MSRRPPIFGSEPWQGSWSHWDLWMCLVAVLDHDGELDGLDDVFTAQLDAWSGRDAGEARWSHLTDLRSRLGEAGFEPADLIAAEHTADRALVAKARRKIAGTGIERRAKTPAMLETPRVRLERRSLYGSWPSFPAPPEPWYDRFRAAVEVKDFTTANQTFKKVSTLEDRLIRLDRAALSIAERLALFRAVHSALIELSNRSDDSYGNIGVIRDDVWESYLAIDWRSTGMDPTAYYRDLSELLVWEKFGLGSREDTLPFDRVLDDEIDLIQDIFLDLESEHRAVHLTWEANEAACQIAWLLVATECIDRFDGAARRIGTDHWMPIVSMAESALEKAGPDAAARVFAAADRPGMHRAYLAEQCHRITGRPLRHLRVVGPEDGK